MSQKALTLTAWSGAVAAAFFIGRQFPSAATSVSPPQHGSATAAESTTGQVSKSNVTRADKNGAEATGRNAEVATQAKSSAKQADTISAALKLVMDEKDPVRRMEQFLSVLGRMKAGDMAEAIQFLNDDPREAGREMSMVLHKWAETDPQSAVAWLEASKNDRLKGWASQEIMQVWAAKDPEAAIAMAQSMGKSLRPDQANPWLSGVIQGMADQQPARAAELAASLPYSRERGMATDAIVKAFFRESPDGTAARTWAESLPDSDSKFKQGALGRVAESWAQVAPEKAAAWVDGLPEGMKGRALASVVGTWADTDANAAGTWLRKFPAGPERNEAVVNFAWTVKDADPEASLTWAGTITDENQRNETSYRLAREWMQRDATTARQWIEQSQLPEGARQKLLGNKGS